MRASAPHKNLAARRCQCVENSSRSAESGMGIDDVSSQGLTAGWICYDWPRPENRSQNRERWQLRFDRHRVKSMPIQEIFQRRCGEVIHVFDGELEKRLLMLDLKAAGRI